MKAHTAWDERSSCPWTARNGFRTERYGRNPSQPERARSDRSPRVSSKRRRTERPQSSSATPTCLISPSRDGANVAAATAPLHTRRPLRSRRRSDGGDPRRREDRRSRPRRRLPPTSSRCGDGRAAATSPEPRPPWRTLWRCGPRRTTGFESGSLARPGWHVVGAGRSRRTVYLTAWVSITVTATESATVPALTSQSCPLDSRLMGSKALATTRVASLRLPARQGASHRASLAQRSMAFRFPASHQRQPAGAL